jgi:hypothetical protein
MPFQYLRWLLLEAAITRRALADHELVAIRKLPYWLRWDVC